MLCRPWSSYCCWTQRDWCLAGESLTMLLTLGGCSSACKSPFLLLAQGYNYWGGVGGLLFSMKGGGEGRRGGTTVHASLNRLIMERGGSLLKEKCSHAWQAAVIAFSVHFCWYLSLWVLCVLLLCTPWNGRHFGVPFVHRCHRNPE